MFRVSKIVKSLINNNKATISFITISFYSQNFFYRALLHRASRVIPILYVVAKKIGFSWMVFITRYFILSFVAMYLTFREVLLILKSTVFILIIYTGVSTEWPHKWNGMFASYMIMYGKKFKQILEWEYNFERLVCILHEWVAGATLNRIRLVTSNRADYYWTSHVLDAMSIQFIRNIPISECFDAWCCCYCRWHCNQEI